MLIADGHHRYGISRTYRDEVRAATGRTDTPAEETLTFVSELVADQLSVAAIHRLYDRMYSEFSQHSFTLTEMERPTPQTLAAMQADGFLVLYTRTGPGGSIPCPARSTASAPSTEPGWSTPWATSRP